MGDIKTHCFAKHFRVYLKLHQGIPLENKHWEGCDTRDCYCFDFDSAENFLCVIGQDSKEWLDTEPVIG